MAKRYKLTNPLQVTRNEPRLEDPVIQAGDNDQEDTAATPVLGSRGTVIQELPVFVASKDPDVAQAIALRRQYLRDTGVTGHMNKLTTELIRSNNLPYNPYPGYIKRFLKIAERFHTRGKSLAEVHQHLSGSPTNVTKSGILTSFKLAKWDLWGLQHILMMLNPKMLSLVGSVVKSSVIQQSKLSQAIKNANILTCLKGPCIFLGSFHNVCYNIQIAVDVVVTASDLQDAAYTFAETILSDLTFVAKDTDHQILSISLTVPEGDDFENKTWSAHDLEPILSSDITTPVKGELLKAIAIAAMNKENIAVNMVLNCGKDSLFLKMKHIGTLKCYRLVAVFNQGNRGNSGSHNFFCTTAPYQAIHEGVFIEQSEAERYLSTFKNYSGYKSPLLSNVINAVKKVWEQKIAGRQMESDMMTLSHYSILIELIQNLVKPITSRKEDSLAVEAYRICQGFGMSLERISALITTMSGMLNSELKESGYELLLQVLSQYRDCLEEFFDETSRDSTVVFAKTRLLHLVNEIEVLTANKSVNKMKLVLDFTEAYLKSLSCDLIDQALDGFPTILRTQSQINASFKVEFGRNLQTDVSTEKYRHKSEAEAFGDVERKIVDMLVSSSALSVSSSNVQQAVRLQYLMDARVDEVWDSFLHDLFMSRQNPPPNPYPLLVRRLREASLKVQLYREDNARIIRKFITARPKLFDKNMRLYTISGVSAFGSIAAISNISPTGFKQASTIALNVAVSTLLDASGSHLTGSVGFEFKCISTLSGNSLMLNSFTPYLTTVSTEEHCFIIGPEEQHADGLSALSQILLNYLENLKHKGVTPTRAIFQDIELELGEMDSASIRFLSLVASTLSSQKPFVLQLVVAMDWRLLLVRKTFHIYYVNKMTNKATFLTSHDELLSLKQVFFNSANAIQYAKWVAATPKSRSHLVKHIAEHARKLDWINMAQLMVAYCFYEEGPSTLGPNDTELALFAWRLFHSPCGSLMYAVAVSEALTDSLLNPDCLLQGNSRHQLVVSTLFGFRNCINKVLSSKSTMVSNALNPYCQHLLQFSSPCKLDDGTAQINKDQLRNTLLHTKGILTAVEDNLALDLLRCTPVIKSLLKDHDDLMNLFNDHSDLFN